MRVRAPSIVVSLAAGAAFVVWLVAAAGAAAQGVYPISAAAGYDVTAVDPGQYSHQQPYDSHGYPIEGVFAKSGDCRRGPRWSFAAEAITLQRTAANDQSLFLSAGGSTELLNAEDFRFPMAYGPKLGAIRHGIFGSDYDVEVGYFQADGFEANASVPGTSRMVFDVLDTFTATNSTARYSSAFYCGEVNVRWQWFDWLTLLSGFRMAELNEQYAANGTGARTLVPVLVSVDANNHLYGYQLGAEGEIYNRGGPLQIKGLCKAGIFGNFADQNIRRAERNGQIYSDDTLGAVSDRASFLGEVGLVATYAVTRRLAFRASYQAVWLEGVALAPEQIDTSNFTAETAKVNLDGGVFYHGGGLGLEYRF